MRYQAKLSAIIIWGWIPETINPFSKAKCFGLKKGIKMEVVIILILLLAVVLGAWIASIDLLISAGRAKGHPMENTGLLWYIGIFASPFVLGLYVAALPDKRAHMFTGKHMQAEDVTSLPSI